MNTTLLIILVLVVSFVLILVSIKLFSTHVKFREYPFCKFEINDNMDTEVCKKCGFNNHEDCPLEDERKHHKPFS